MNEDIPCTLEQGAICVLNDRCKDDNLLSIGASCFIALEAICVSNNAIMIPIFESSQKNCLTITINQSLYYVSVGNPLLISVNLLQIVETKQLDRPQNVIASIRRNQKRLMWKQWERTTSPSIFSANTPFYFFQGTLCKLNNKCNDKNLIFIGATYFLVVEDCAYPKKVKTVPVFDAFRDKSLTIRICATEYWASIEPSIDIPFTFLSEVKEKHLDKPRRALDIIKKGQDNPERYRNFFSSAVAPSQSQYQKPLFDDSVSHKFHIGDICELLPNYKSKLEGQPNFLLVVEYYSKNEVLIAPIRAHIKYQRNGKRTEINGEEFWIDIFAREKVLEQSMIFVKHEKQELVDEVILRNEATKEVKKKNGKVSQSARKMNPGSLVSLRNADASENSVFIVVEKNPQLKSLLVVPLLFEKNRDRPRKSVKINNKTYHVGARFPEVLSSEFLCTAPYLKLDERKKDLEAIRNICKQTKIYALYQEGIEINAYGINYPLKNTLSSISILPQNKTLYIYKGRIVCHRRGHSIIPATATFYDGSGNKVKIDVEYCQECQRQMMSYTSFTYYRDSFGVLVGNLKMIGSEGFDGEFNMAEESPLRLCGYTVSQQAGLTESTRHYILAKVVHDGIMSKVDVIRYLEHFINMNGSKEGNELALSKWENDLKFVHKYRIDTQPEVYITKVEKY